MLKPWHKEDAFSTLQARGWTGPDPLAYPEDWHYVGEAWCFSRANWTLNLYFVADYGTGFAGAETVESIAGRLVGDAGEYDLWLRRTRDAKWKASVSNWADAISVDRSSPPSGTYPTRNFPGARGAPVPRPITRDFRPFSTKDSFELATARGRLPLQTCEKRVRNKATNNP